MYASKYLVVVFLYCTGEGAEGWIPVVDPIGVVEEYLYARWIDEQKIMNRRTQKKSQIQIPLPPALSYLSI